MMSMQRIDWPHGRKQATADGESQVANPRKSTMETRRSWRSAPIPRRAWPRLDVPCALCRSGEGPPGQRYGKYDARVKQSQFPWGHTNANPSSTVRLNRKIFQALIEDRVLVFGLILKG